MSLRPFDVLGTICVTGWLVLLASFAYVNISKEASTADISNQVVLTEGDSWMVLRRGEDDVGYVHETRTRVENGWLLEYEMILVIDFAGTQRALETHTRATLDKDAVLRQFQGDITSFIGSFRVTGEVLEDKIEVTADMRGIPTTRTIPLQEPPRLSNSAFNQLVATPDDLVPGKRYEHKFFDPMSQSMKVIAYEFVESKEVETYGNKTFTYHFRQQMMGDEFDVYVSREGEIVIQEFPMQTYGQLVPSAFGKSHAATFRRNLKKELAEQPDIDAALEAQAKQDAQPQQLGVQGALKTLSNILNPPQPGDADMGASDADMSDAADMGAAPSPDAADQGKDSQDMQPATE